MENVVVHCGTENEAQELLRFLYKKGFTWSSGQSLIGRSYWHIYEENTCYHIDNTKKSITIGNINGHNGKYIIITFKQFMKTKELKIEIPEGFEIDIENSDLKSGTVKFKPKILTYDSIAEELFNKRVYYITDSGEISTTLTEEGLEVITDANNCTSEKQAQKLLAINKLMNVAKYLNDGWKPDWGNYERLKYYIRINRGHIGVSAVTDFCSDIAFFKTEELAEQAIEILGKETIKLALSTDW